MSWYPRRQVIDGNYNVFKNISALTGGSATPTASTVAEWDANVNMSASAFSALETMTAASGTPLVLTIASTQVQTITGTTTAQTIELPTTGVTAGYIVVVSNQCSSAAVTVEASGGGTIGTVPVQSIGVFRAWIDTPYLPVHWTGDIKTGAVLTVYNGQLAITYNGTETIYYLPSSPTPAVSTLAMWDTFKTLSANAFIALQTLTAASSTPIALSYASTQVQAITGTTTAQTMLLPTTGIPAGYEVVIINDMTTATVTVEASGGGVVGLLAPNEIGVFRSTVATPTLDTQWTADSRLSGVTFKVNTAKLVIGTNGTDVAYTLPATASTLLASGGALGTPSSGILTNLTGSPTLTAPALGTPISGVLSSCTGYLASALSGTVAAATQLSGTVPIANGGTNASTAAAGLANLAAAGIPNNLLPDGILNANSAQQAQATVAATNYYITNSQLALPATYLQGMTAPSGSGGTVKCGTVFRWRVTMTKNGNGTGTFNFLIFRGTNGTTSDTADVSQVLAAAMSAASDTITVDVQVTVVTTGATGSYFWSMTAVHAAASTTGFGLGASIGAPLTFTGTVSSVAMNTAALVFGLGFVCGAGGTMPTLAVPVVQAQAFNID